MGCTVANSGVLVRMCFVFLLFVCFNFTAFSNTWDGNEASKSGIDTGIEKVVVSWYEVDFYGVSANL